jgi:hypothetical protein
MPLVIKGSSSGQVTVDVPAAAGTNTVTIPAATGNLPLSDLDHVTNRQNAKPLIINGGMTVAQRGTSFTGQTGSSYLLDRIYMRLGGVGTWTITQDTDVPSGYGFTNSLKMDCTTANSSLDATDFIFINMRFEKQDMRIFNKGTSDAKKITVAAWVKSPTTGTHVVGLYDANSSTNRYCMQTYTISSANTWTKAIVTFPADTGGDEMGTDNTHGMNLQFWFAAGSNYSSGSAATAWENYTQANQAVGQVNCSSSTDNNILITGIQMEVGEYDSTTLPPFQHESHGDNLARCQRYCQVYGAYANTMLGFGHTHDQTNVYRWGFPLGVEMRAAPTASLSGTNGFWNGSIGANAVLGTSYNKTDLVDIDCTCDTGGLVNDQGRLTKLYMNTGTLTLDSEL